MPHYVRILCIVLIAAVSLTSQSQGQSSPYRFKAAADNSDLEWFFLLVDAGKAQGIWSKHGLEPDFIRAAATAEQLADLVKAGVAIGFVNTAEVPLARSRGTPVKIVAGYFGETTARIYVAAESSINYAADLDGKKIGIVATTHTSYRTVLFMNRALGIRAEPMPLGSLQNNLAALTAGTIDAFYSSEGAALSLADAGPARMLLPLAKIYPKPYTAVVVWTTDEFIDLHRDLVHRFVGATLEIAEFIKTHPHEAQELYMARTRTSRRVAEIAVKALAQVMAPDGQGSGRDLMAAVKGNWEFITKSGAVSDGGGVRIEDVVDTSFLPP